MLNKVSRTLILTSVIIGAFLTTSLANAQINPTESAITYVTVPNNITPNTVTTITLNSSAVNLDTSTITWLIDGKLADQGVGKRTIKVSVGGVGSKTTLIAKIAKDNITVVEKTITLTPTQTVLIYEASTYTPPFYKGKALPSTQSKVTLWAQPQIVIAGKKLNPKNLVYTWRTNGQVDGTNSGVGKDTYTFSTGNFPEDTPIVSVTATSPSDGVSSSATFNTPSVKPKIVFYENNPLLGTVLNNALVNRMRLNSSETSIIAVPYFFGGSKDSRDLTYHWSLNGSEIAEPEGARSLLTVRRPDASGETIVGLSIESGKRLFLSAENSLRIEYGN